MTFYRQGGALTGRPGCRSGNTGVRGKKLKLDDFFLFLHLGCMVGSAAD